MLDLNTQLKTLLQVARLGNLTRRANLTPQVDRFIEYARNDVMKNNRLPGLELRR
jgi:hypothetical protein